MQTRNFNNTSEADRAETRRRFRIFNEAYVRHYRQVQNEAETTDGLQQIKNETRAKYDRDALHEASMNRAMAECEAKYGD